MNIYYVVIFETHKLPNSKGNKRNVADLTCIQIIKPNRNLFEVQTKIADSNITNKQDF